MTLPSFPRSSRRNCAEVFLKNCLRMCNVLASMLSEKKEARSSEEASQSNLVIAVPGEMETSATGPCPELMQMSGMG